MLWLRGAATFIVVEPETRLRGSRFRKTSGGSPQGCFAKTASEHLTSFLIQTSKTKTRLERFHAQASPSVCSTASMHLWVQPYAPGIDKSTISGRFSAPIHKVFPDPPAEAARKQAGPPPAPPRKPQPLPFQGTRMRSAQRISMSMPNPMMPIRMMPMITMSVSVNLDATMIIMPAP